MTNFRLVSAMNIAFGNPRGTPDNINWPKVQKQSLNIIDEFCELMTALGADKETMKQVAAKVKQNVQFVNQPNLPLVRDSLTDIHVFAYGSHHFMGLDADRDMESVIKGVMTRFVRDDKDKQATIEKHAAAGVTKVYFEGNYPVMIMKSAEDQPDAPKGKFLKSASYTEPTFYDFATENVNTPDGLRILDESNAAMLGTINGASAVMAKGVS